MTVCASAAETEDWNVHAQSTYLWQTKSALHSPYAGPNSLTADPERSYSFTATAFLGARLGPSTELYLNPEAAQGIPLSGLLGLAGFTNGELAKTSGPDLTVYRARLFVRHTWNLGGEQQSIESDANQLAGEQSAQRLVLTLGNVSILDVFDNNAYAHDPRVQFMNWALMTYAAYDYAADARGYTTGATVEYVCDAWKLRFGRYAVPQLPNQMELDGRIGRHYGDQLEFDHDYELLGKKGAFHALAFRNQAVMATYADALAIADRTGTAPALADARTGLKAKQGLGLAAELDLGKGMGVFAHAMRSDGHTETYSFTEADRSLAGGLSLSGQGWGRPQDLLGLAWARSELSAGHREFLSRGGVGAFIGDGRLNYGPEQVVEAFYRVDAGLGIQVSLNWQHIVNPGYNVDRGPGNFSAIRLHWSI